MARKDTGKATRRGEEKTRGRRSPRADVSARPSPSAPSRVGRAGRPARKSSDADVDSRAVCVWLTSQQVDEVLREGREAIKMRHLLAGLVARDEIPPFPHWEARYREDVRGGRFSLSTLKAMLVLAQLVSGEHGVIEVAERLQMGASAIHRYLATLQILGLVAQDPKSRKYRLAW